MPSTRLDVTKQKINIVENVWGLSGGSRDLYGGLRGATKRRTLPGRAGSDRKSISQAVIRHDLIRVENSGNFFGAALWSIASLRVEGYGGDSNVWDEWCHR